MTEVVIRKEDTYEDLLRKARIAAFLGTLQSTLTDFKYLRKQWQRNAEEERLLGVSLTGIMDHDIMSGQWSGRTDAWECGIPEGYTGSFLEYFLGGMRKVVKDTNIKYADSLGINHSGQLTLVKPSGTVSSLVGSASGIHPRYSDYYIRRATQDNKDPLTQLMIDQGIPHVVSGDKTIFSFPLKSPEGSVSRDNLGPIEQLELWKIYRDHWCDGNPSQTIYYTDDTFMDITSWVWKHWDSIGGLSFFPTDDNVYDNQPFEEIDKDEYDRLVAEFPEVDFTMLPKYERDDAAVSVNREVACSGGACDVL